MVMNAVLLLSAAYVQVGAPHIAPRLKYAVATVNLMRHVLFQCQLMVRVGDLLQGNIISKVDSSEAQQETSAAGIPGW